MHVYAFGLKLLSLWLNKTVSATFMLSLESNTAVSSITLCIGCSCGCAGRLCGGAPGNSPRDDVLAVFSNRVCFLRRTLAGLRVGHHEVWQVSKYTSAKDGIQFLHP